MSQTSINDSEVRYGQDAYEIFTQAHRVYIKGIRAAISERLQSAYGAEWWQRGVLPALGENQRENLERDLQKGAPDDMTQLLDTAHFSRIVERNHAAAFANEFTNIDYTLRLFSHLSVKRNEWAHILDGQWTVPDIMQSVQAMREILISLRRREALEIHQMFQNSLDHQGSIPEEALAGVEDSPDDDDGNSSVGERSLLGFWHALESYLVVESTVRPAADEEQDNGRVSILVRVTNTAPASEGRPNVVFRNVMLEVNGAAIFSGRDRRRPEWSELEPGQTVTSEFASPAKGLASIEFRVSGDVDRDRLFQVQRRNTLPEEAVSPLLEQLSRQFEDVGIEETLAKVIGTVDRIQPDMTFAEVSTLRNELTELKSLISDKREAMGALFQEYHLSPESPLGASLLEAISLLHELEAEKINAMDNAISNTDLDSIQALAHDFEQLQILVLRARETIRQRMGLNRP